MDMVQQKDLLSPPLSPEHLARSNSQKSSTTASLSSASTSSTASTTSVQSPCIIIGNLSHTARSYNDSCRRSYLILVNLYDYDIPVSILDDEQIRNENHTTVNNHQKDSNDKKQDSSSSSMTTATTIATTKNTHLASCYLCHTCNQILDRFTPKYVTKDFHSPGLLSNWKKCFVDITKNNLQQTEIPYLEFASAQRTSDIVSKPGFVIIPYRPPQQQQEAKEDDDEINKHANNQDKSSSTSASFSTFSSPPFAFPRFCLEKAPCLIRCDAADIFDGRQLSSFFFNNFSSALDSSSSPIFSQTIG